MRPDEFGWRYDFGMVVGFARRSRLALLPALVAAAILTFPAIARAASAPGSSCVAGAPSAVNQYCEDIPSSTGSHLIVPGSPALAAVLPPGRLRQVTRTAKGSARYGLLHLPAAGKPSRLGSSEASLGSNGAGLGSSGASVSGWSLFAWLALLLGTLTFIAVAYALVRRRGMSSQSA